MDLLNEEEFLNRSIDFSFELDWEGTGDWGNYKDYEVAVSNVAREALPEKEVMHSIPVSTITRKVSKPLSPV